jgi:hypothetical protein
MCATTVGKVEHRHSLTIHLDDFAWDAVREASLQLGVPNEELVRFAVLYYLADSDSGRLARRLHASPPEPADSR